MKLLGWAGRGPGSTQAEGRALPASLPRGQGATGSEIRVRICQLWGSAGGGRRREDAWGQVFRGAGWGHLGGETKDRNIYSLFSSLSLLAGISGD